ncbi:WD repeat-containing protein 87-like [Oncorhynchus keta]|uniref:WD repeat-containing protein 87-like n=1 Tax=Oncorhynchus keta TaxID=8018 RepID=UPI0015FA73D8|nr:WD repeat-containing protein 87-like [Oncorhynchus keta]
MTSMRRIVPEWKYFLPQLKQTIKEVSDPDEDEVEEETALCLDATPTMQFQYSCAQNYLQCLTTNSSHSGTVVVGFQWGHTMTSHRMEVWTENLRGDLKHNLSLPLDRGYRVEHLVSVPSQRIFVGACDDLSLRVFSDPTQGMAVLYRANCLGSVLCMHYCKETEELLTGSMGIITFWGFWTNLQTHLGIIKVLDWHCTSLRRDTTISGLVTERQASTLYALCNRGIKCFDFVEKKECRALRGHGQGTLRCVSPDWVQRYLCTGDMIGFVQVWSWDTRSLLQEFRAHARTVSTVLMRPSTHTLLTSSTDGWVKEWSCSGDLLLKLFLDDPGGVRNLWPLGEHRILCHSPSSFSIWRLQNLYRLFNDPGCGMQLLRRVESSRGQAQLLAVSQDSIARLISPISGELLLLSWPFLLLDQALGFAYNPSRKELFVASGSPEVLVLDMALCPCTAKRIIRTSRDQDLDDSVMCLEAVMVGGAEWAGVSPLPCLVFSGHRNGKLQLLSPHRLGCPARKAHDGAILQMSSLAGPKPQLCCYGSDKQFSIWEVEMGEVHVEVAPLARVSCSSDLVLSRLLSGQVFAVSPNYSLLFFSLPSGGCLWMERNPPTSISCLDYCSALGLVVVSGPEGTLEVWETRGVQLAEIHLGMPVSQLCFANTRGDLLACFGGTICIISGLRYLPARLLQQVLDLAPADYILEDPIPFLPRSQSCYDIYLVPRMFLKPGQATPELNETPAVLDVVRPESTGCKNVLDVLNRDRKKNPLMIRAPTPPIVKGDQPGSWSCALRLVKTLEEELNLEDEPMEGSEDRDKSQTPFEPLPPDTLHLDWPVAPDGFLPNSVLRNWNLKQEPPKAILPKEAKALCRTLSQSEDEPEHSPVVTAILAKAKEARLNKPIPMPKLFDTPTEYESPPEDDTGNGNELLKHISESLWLVSRPDVDLVEVMKSLMLTMEGMDSDVYGNCTEALFSMFQTYDIPVEIINNLTFCLLKHIQKGNPHWKRLEAMKNLDQIDHFQDKHLYLLAEVLLDPAMELREMAKNILSRVYGIDNKTSLLNRMQANEDVPKMLYKHLERTLSDDLEHKKSTDAPAKPIGGRLSRPYVHRDSRPFLECTAEDNGTPSSEQDHMRTPDLPLIRSLGCNHESSTLKEEPGLSPPGDDFMRPHRSPKKFRKFSLSTAKWDSIVAIPEEGHVQVYDPTIIELYKKSKPHKQLCSQLPTTKVPSDSGVSSMGLSKEASLVQLPDSPQHLRLKPVKGKGKGDPNWRESLYKLVSQYGFRSPRARLTTLGPLDVPGAAQRNSCTLSPFQTRKASQVSLGQRVVRKIQLRESSFERPASQFHHGLPLPWQLNSHTMDPSGESMYGRLEVDWVREPMEPQRGKMQKVKLPPIMSRCHPS